MHLNILHMTLDTISDWHKDAHPFSKLQRLVATAQTASKAVPVRGLVGGLDIRCGPLLRFITCLEEKSTNYRASILLVLNGATSTSEPKITYTLGPLVARSPSQFSTGEFPRTKIATKSGFSFHRFEINFELNDEEQKCRYIINDTAQYDFFLPSRDQSMNIVSYSCNGFSLSTKTEEFKGSLWLDVLRKHSTEQRYHVMLGGGDQIYCDAIKNSSKEFNKWTAEANPIKKRLMKLDEKMEESFHEFYLNQYISWFGSGYSEGTNGWTLQSCLPIALASIPTINIFDDHDIIDGFGSYHDSTMRSEIFSAVGKVAYEYYMLFQHQTSITEAAHEEDPAWILGKTGDYIGQKSHSIFAKLGKGIGFIGLDCRTERKLKEIVSPDTYKVVFDRLRQEVTQDPSIRHILVLLGVPIAYPRLVWLETLLSSPILAPLRTMARKGVIAKGLVNEFDGSIEVLDDLNDHWCSHNHKKERNKLVGQLQEFGAANGVRITILSGDVHLAAVGRFKSKLHLNHLLNRDKYKEINDTIRTSPETDPKLMFNIISSAIVNTPPPNAMATLLYKRSGIHHFDRSTDEDMVPIFQFDVDGEKRRNNEFLNRRNWCDIIPFRNHNQAGYVLGDFRLPGPLSVDQKKLQKQVEIREERELLYPVTDNCLVSRIHVEKDAKSLESTTESYELIIPELIGKYKLDAVGEK